jgi:D-serine deaminase-like pyridoxal phosphate-dependent protein
MTDPYPELDTPSLLFDLEVLERNLHEMAGVARDAGVQLRPHTKTHKCPDIAWMQTEAGAGGITVAKLGEAEVMANAGLDDILVAYPIWGEPKLGRLRGLMERTTVRVCLDSVEVAEGIGRVGTDLGREVPVLIEVDTGLHRLGRPPGEASAALAIHVSEIAGVEVVGLLTHAGHAYRCADAAALHAAAEREVRDLLETAERCAEAGLTMREISVGSTPTARIAAQVEGVTEIRPGTYIFNDVQQMRLGVTTEETCAARILVTVIARPSTERFVVDAGTKSFTSDGGDGPPFPGRGVVRGRPELRLDFMSEEHGVGHIEGDARLEIGDRLEVIPLHICGAVNMFDTAYGVRREAVEHVFELTARGKVQ